jgi:hypothetical protein
LSFGRTRPPTPAEARAKEKARVKRAALRALKRTKALADKAGVTLSDWEGEFLDTVAERVTTYGRAFADPEKGGSGGALSALQTRKLKEIAAKAEGKPPAVRRFGRKRPEGAGE